VSPKVLASGWCYIGLDLLVDADESRHSRTSYVKEPFYKIRIREIE